MGGGAPPQRRQKWKESFLYRNRPHTLTHFLMASGVTVFTARPNATSAILPEKLKRIFGENKSVPMVTARLANGSKETFSSAQRKTDKLFSPLAPMGG